MRKCPQHPLLITKSFIHSLIFQVLYSFHNGTFAVRGSEKKVIPSSPRVYWLKHTARIQCSGLDTSFWLPAFAIQLWQCLQPQTIVSKKLWTSSFLLLGRPKSVSFTSGQESGLCTSLQGKVQIMATKLTSFTLVVTNKLLNVVFLILKLNFQYKEK